MAYALDTHDLNICETSKLPCSTIAKTNLPQLTRPSSPTTTFSKTVPLSPKTIAQTTYSPTSLNKGVRSGPPHLCHPPSGKEKKHGEGLPTRPIALLLVLFLMPATRELRDRRQGAENEARNPESVASFVFTIYYVCMIYARRSCETGVARARARWR